MGIDPDDPRKKLRRVRGNDGKKEACDWSNCDAELLQKTISAAGAKRGALRFGYTRDGGAFAVGVYVGSDYFTDYIRPGEDIDDYLKDLLISFEEYLPMTEMESKAQRQKKR